MSNQADHTIVRLRVPPELKKLIEESAEQNNRSQSAEMVHRLEQSFSSNTGSAWIEASHIVPLKGDAVNDPNQRKKMAVIASAAAALDEIPANELFTLIFKKFNSSGLSLTVEEIKHGEELSKSNAPVSKSEDDWT